MNRRELILVAGAVIAPRALRAQQKTMPVIGWLSPGAPGPMTPFRQGLSYGGYVEGHDLAIVYCWAEGRHDRLRALALAFAIGLALVAQPAPISP